ncbi:MAG: hypothetical protein SLAVMIC_00118 [uncultured marine phage]|uniref:Uncharacterized protein n=1 Tax=uncultured marine phage TaxID=707152 RepID=A0A8D9FPY9_9VIRU|nr:MAG: hypothetical protein SLAVMIC_00118 [uncultured marine phage]
MKKFNEFIKENNDPIGRKSNYQDIKQASELLSEAKKLIQDARGIIGDDNIKSNYIKSNFESVEKTLFELDQTVSDELHWDEFFKLDDESLGRHSEKYD